MKIECGVEKIKNAILQAEKITGKNLTLPILSSILFIATNKTLKLRATNLSLGVEIEIPAKIEKEGIVAVSGNALANIFSNISVNENVLLENENGNLLIKTKKNKILLKGQPADDFPTIPLVSGNTFEIESKKLVEGIKSVYYAAAVSDIKPEISSVYFYSENDSLIFVSTDSFRLAEKKIKLKKLEDIGGILVPFKNVVEILRVFSEQNNLVKVCFNKNQISFESENIYLTSRVIDGVFPDYRQIMPKEFSTEVVVLKQDFMTALKLANIFSDRTNQINLNIKVKSKSFEMFSRNNEVGENKTQLEAVLKGEDVEIGFNYKYFLDCLQSINADSLSIMLNGAAKPMVVSGNNDNSFTYLIMPMNR